MNSVIIYSHAQTFKAYRCGVCGALDSDPITLAKHQEMHGLEREGIKSAWVRTPGPRGPQGHYHKSGKTRKKRGGIHVA